MNIIAYCYGPFSIEKNSFCENFTKINKDFKLIKPHLLRKKITGSILATDKSIELELGKLIKNECLKILTSNKKQKNILINGLFLNKESRIALSQLFSPDEQKQHKTKKVAIAFIEKDLTQCFEDIKTKKEFKEVSFDILKSQFLNFKIASTEEEADILINNIEEYGGRLNLDTKLWGKDTIIACDSLKKVAEYIKHANSFQ
jgi:hypothetical protein